MLPQTSEKELIRALKQYRDIPVIIVSAISDVNMTVTLFELGAVGVIILNMIKADLYRILKRKAIYITLIILLSLISPNCFTMKDTSDVSLR